MSVSDNPNVTQCQYCGLPTARNIEKYLGIIPYKINNDDKYLDAVDKIKKKVLEISQNPLTSKPKCAPKNKKSVPEDFSIPYIYHNPIPPKYNTGEPGFAIVQPNKKSKLKCFLSKIGGKRRRRRKKTRKKYKSKYNINMAKKSLRKNSSRRRKRTSKRFRKRGGGLFSGHKTQGSSSRARETIHNCDPACEARREKERWEQFVAREKTKDPNWGKLTPEYRKTLFNQEKSKVIKSEELTQKLLKKGLKAAKTVGDKHTHIYKPSTRGTSEARIEELKKNIHTTNGWRKSQMRKQDREYTTEEREQELGKHKAVNAFSKGGRRKRRTRKKRRRRRKRTKKKRRKRR
jgi:hypothetical protein